MSIRTTVTLDEDDLLRVALLQQQKKPRRRKLRITPIHMGYRGGLNYDDVGSLLEYGEGERHL